MPAFAVPSPRPPGPAPAAVLRAGLVLALVAWLAHDARALAASGAASGLGTPVLAAVVLAGRALGWLLEALGYALVWRAAGRRLRVLPFAAALAALSLADVAAAALRALDPGGAAPPITALAGRVPGPGEGALSSSIAGFGLCAFARMVGTAGAQARALGRGFGAPLVLTVTLWLLSRLALALVFDLARGRSPL